MPLTEVQKQPADQRPIQDSPERYTGPVARPDGSLPTGLEMIRNLNEVFDTGEKDEISFVRGMLRCLGHSAIGTDAENWPIDQEIPQVSPWKLTKALAKATVNKERRRAMMGRIKEDMHIGDSMGLLAVLSIYDAGKHSGFSKKEAQQNAWGWYSKFRTKPNKK